jgi:hypothetical protein
VARIYDALAIIALSTLLSTSGLAAYLFSVGRLNVERLETIAAVLRGESLVAPGAAEAAAAPPPPSSQPALAQAEGAPTAEELREARRRGHIESLRLERARRDLEAQQRLLQLAMQQLIAEQESFTLQKSDFEQQRERLLKAELDEGFAKELEYVSGLPPKLAKEHILRSWEKHPVDAVRLFMRIDAGRGKRILEQFKSPAELRIMHELLERVRLSGATQAPAPAPAADAAQ